MIQKSFKKNVVIITSDAMFEDNYPVDKKYIGKKLPQRDITEKSVSKNNTPDDCKPI